MSTPVKAVVFIHLSSTPFGVIWDCFGAAKKNVSLAHQNIILQPAQCTKSRPRE